MIMFVDVYGLYNKVRGLVLGFELRVSQADKTGCLQEHTMQIRSIRLVWIRQVRNYLEQEEWEAIDGYRKVAAGNILVSFNSG